MNITTTSAQTATTCRKSAIGGGPPEGFSVFNAGSTSFKASLYDLQSPAGDGAEPSGLVFEGLADSSADIVKQVSGLWTGPEKKLSGAADIDAIGHRVVFGGPNLFATTRIDDDLKAQPVRMEEYAPGDNESALAVMDETTRMFPDRIPQFAVFDTAFHQTLSPLTHTLVHMRGQSKEFESSDFTG